MFSFSIIQILCNMQVAIATFIVFFSEFSDSKHRSEESEVVIIQKLSQLSEKHFIGLSLFLVSMTDCKLYFSK